MNQSKGKIATYEDVKPIEESEDVKESLEIYKAIRSEKDSLDNILKQANKIQEELEKLQQGELNG